MSRVFNIFALAAATAASAAASPGPAGPPPAPPAASVSISDRGVSVRGGGASIEVRVPHVESATTIEPFTPDLYPSQAEAARGLGELWAKRATRGPGDGIESVRVYCCDSAVYAGVVEGIRTRLPDVRIGRPAPGTCPQGFHEESPGDGEAFILLESREGRHVVANGDVTTGESGHLQPPRRVRTGVSLTLTARGAADAAATVSYVDVPWLSDLRSYAAANPGRRFVVGRTDPLRPAMTQSEAARAVRRAAADELFALVRARVPRHGRHGADDAWVRRHVEQALAGGQLVAEQFPQRYARPYGGDTWREAVLVDASEPAVAHLAGDLTRRRSAETRSWLMTVASAGGVLLVTYALYRLANAFTRGYFVWSLRTAAAVVATSAVVLLLMVIG